jgi:hypothetical protein
MLKITNLYQNHLYNKLKFNQYGIEKHNQKYKKQSYVFPTPYNYLTNYKVSSSRKLLQHASNDIKLEFLKRYFLISCHKAVQTIFYYPNQSSPILPYRDCTIFPLTIPLLYFKSHPPNLWNSKVQNCNAKE